MRACENLPTGVNLRCGLFRSTFPRYWGANCWIRTSALETNLKQRAQRLRPLDFHHSSTTLRCRSPFNTSPRDRDFTKVRSFTFLLPAATACGCASPPAAGRRRVPFSFGPRAQRAVTTQIPTTTDERDTSCSTHIAALLLTLTCLSFSAPSALTCAWSGTLFHRCSTDHLDGTL